MEKRCDRPSPRRVKGEGGLPALVLDLFLDDELDEEFFMALLAPGEWHEDEGCLAGEKTVGAMAEW